MTSKLVWQAEDVLRAVRGQCLHEQAWTASGISINSRTMQPGDLFIALEGPAKDGHEYVAAALNAGAAAAIVAKQPAQAPLQAPLVFVTDTFKALQELGTTGRARAEARIIAVTGSVGKTGTKEMLRLMLGATGDTYANEGNLNNHWGVPLSLARLPAAARYGVFEIGMNHAGELGPLSQTVKPEVALITTIEAVHLEYFASLDAIADAKAEIFEGLRPGGAAVLNRDNAQFARLAAAAKAQGVKSILSFGRDNKADAKLLECKAESGGSTLRAEIMGRATGWRLNAPGEHLVMNALGALLSVAALGADVEACAAALAHYRPPKGRGVIETLPIPGGEITLIDESYNASPAAMRFAIRVLGQMTPGSGGRRILVLGDMRELGTSAPALHAELARGIIEARIDSVFCCGEMMMHLYDALPAALRGGQAQDSNALAPLVAKAVHVGDIVSVKGSHSLQMERVIEALIALGAPDAKHKMAS